MQTSAIDAAAGTTTQSATNNFGGMKSVDFFKLLVTELRNQDPFEPSDTSDMISQVSQIRSIELSDRLTNTLQQMSDQQHSMGVADLIGKYVEGRITNPDGSTQVIAGVVTAVTFAADGQAVLELDTGMSMSASDVSLISTLEQLEALLPAADDTDDADDGETADKSQQLAKPDWLRMDTSIRL